MSLQVWLPLTNGTLKQQGLKNAAATIGGTVGLTDTGKLGKCATIGTAAGGITLPASTMTSFVECSVAFWIKIISWNTSYATFFQAGLSSTPWNNYIFGILRNNANSNLCFTLTNSSSSSSQASYVTSNLNTGQWYHLAFTYKAGTICTYIDGVLDKTYSTTYVPNFAGITNISIGRCTNNSGYQTNCNLNDFRIYDHCLSPMEVKELAKGLVLHYPLNRQGWGQENLITQAMIDAEPWKSAISGNYTIDGKTGWILSNNLLYSKSGSGANNIFSGLTFEENTQYTISFKWRDDYRTDGKSSSLYIRFKYSDGTYSQVILPKNDYWKEEVMTSTAGKTVSAITTTYGNGGNLLFTDLKLEKGAIKTPTSPIVNSDLYNSMGLNSTTEYDCSGFCNNGSKMTETIAYTSDTAKYQVSTHFNGTYDGILIENLQLSDIINSAVTYAFWIKPESESGARSVYFGSYNTGPSWSIEKTTGNVMRSYWNGSPDETCSGATITDGVWQHVCLTKSGTNDIKVYINGVQKWASTATHSNLSFPTTYRIGRDTRSNDGTPYKGLMSDFRIYATALSADDVLSLYQNSAYIDSSGNVYGTIHEV